jgi:hypothetical protein
MIPLFPNEWGKLSFEKRRDKRYGDRNYMPALEDAFTYMKRSTPYQMRTGNCPHHNSSTEIRKECY